MEADLEPNRLPRINERARKPRPFDNFRKDRASVSPAAIARVAVDFGGTFTLTHRYEANASDTAHPLFSAMSAAIKDVTGSDATFTLGLGCTDNRLWRGMGTPVGVYGGEPTLQGKVDEWIGFEELGEIARVHAQTTARFLLNPS